MKGKKKLIVPLVLLILLGGVYKTVLAKPPAKEKAKIDGTVRDSHATPSPSMYTRSGLSCCEIRTNAVSTKGPVLTVSRCKPAGAARASACASGSSA